MDEPRVFQAEDLRTGLRAEFEREITAEDIGSFAALSGDRNPLHIDDAYASQTNYGGRIVHGAFQVALASAMAGMYLPGRNAVVGSFQCRFPAPLHYPSRVRIEGEITAWVPKSASGLMRVRAIELSSMALTAEIHVGFSLHETRGMPAEEVQNVAAATSEDGKPGVLVTGASGGLGRHLTSALSRSYSVIAMARSVPSVAGNAEWVAAALLSADWEDVVSGHLRGRRLYGVVHAAWPAGPQGGLLDAVADGVREQVEFGGIVTIRIAQFLRSHSAGSARLVVLGSTAGTLKPVLNMSAYSLGKAVLEHTVRLLAPELARSGITVNLVAPSFLPLGMNSSKTSPAVLSETAKVPVGRLCAPEDVAAAVEYFLSAGAAFVTGQILPLTGGQL
jgi:NAD(P)-dependent dehydrogenase (short-subunit alcohol dehydrogenase family)/acyl dehydratase